VAKEKDPAEIIATIAQSIRVSQRGSRRVRAHGFKELFGYQVLSAPRREKIEQLMAEAGIEVRPSLEEAKRDDWLVMSMPVEIIVIEVTPDPAPTPEVLRVDQAELADSFDDLYSRLNPQAAAVARQAKISRLTEAR
jgi:hypothetical protein